MLGRYLLKRLRTKDTEDKFIYAFFKDSMKLYSAHTFEIEQSKFSFSITVNGLQPYTAHHPNHDKFYTLKLAYYNHNYHTTLFYGPDKVSVKTRKYKRVYVKLMSIAKYLTSEVER
jgi:hypothetical protein